FTYGPSALISGCVADPLLNFLGISENAKMATYSCWGFEKAKYAATYGDLVQSNNGAGKPLWRRWARYSYALIPCPKCSVALVHSATSAGSRCQSESV